MALAVLKSFFSLAPLLNWRVLDKVGICLKLLLSSSVCDLFFIFSFLPAFLLLVLQLYSRADCFQWLGFGSQVGSTTYHFYLTTAYPSPGRSMLGQLFKIVLFGRPQFSEQLRWLVKSNCHLSFQVMACKWKSLNSFHFIWKVLAFFQIFNALQCFLYYNFVANKVNA